MDISKHLNGVKISTGNASVFIDPDGEVDSGVVIFTESQGISETNDKRLIIEGPGEYEFQGIYLKGTKKNDLMSFVISYNSREIYFTNSKALDSIPDDEPFDAVIIKVDPDFDETKLTKIAYPTVYLDNSNVLSEKADADTVKSVNLKKIVPEEKNIYKLS